MKMLILLATAIQYSRSISLPTPSKLVSAMKVSREKQGRESKKLSVTWAPGVYDLVPTAASHVPTNKNYRHRRFAVIPRSILRASRRVLAANLHEARARTCRKQPRKSSGSSTSKLRSPRSKTGAVGFSESEGSLDYNYGSLDWDLFCGSSFLRRFVSECHFTVREST